ncbi:uncharacterized protein N7496_005400 [Penicillium cataractarum]|uniref:Zn(2)-C6 fungal-type domain-containing protein n=1 Tax=Penicillium cataractarum TaxID=2100454 RepID=A0A9W9SG20_9EURO|nr:uncharacterized protein N7496_005400 [Penicillium cataractarum]KAJ5377991.1 hypothetical protein N7496_005400 [Penicillium cataractarum]
MKRKSAHESTTPQKQPRQDPVSCESCRKKKTKCDRQVPCGSCKSRRIDCTYGGNGPVAPSPVATPVDQVGDVPCNSVTSSQPIQATEASRESVQTRSTEDPLMTADRLENILMGHRIPSAVPSALREELSRPQPMQATRSRPHKGTAISSFLTMIRDGGYVSSEHPATVHLASFLPPEDDALSLFNYYLSHLDYQYHIVVPARTEQNIRYLYRALARGWSEDLNSIALLFSILATALFYQLLSTESSEVAENCSREMAFLAGAALVQSNYVAYPTIEGLQAAMIIGHHLSSLTLNSCVSSLFLHGGLVSQAKSLGLHLLDSPRVVAERQEKGIDKAETELKRRLWWDLASYDWYKPSLFYHRMPFCSQSRPRLIGFLSGPQEWTYTIHPQHMNVRRPLNREDDIIGIETGLPLIMPTCMSYTLQRLKLAEVCREIVDAAAPYHLQGKELPYETVLDLDRKLQQAYSEIPAFFRFDQSSRRQFATLYLQRREIAWQRAFIQQGYHSRLCRLHRQYFIRGARDPRYSYSHVVSLQSARKVLEVKRIMDEEEPLFTVNSSFFWAVMHHVFMAAVILLIDVCFNWDDILASKRKEEVLDACRLLSRAQQCSSVAREGINAMMGILRKHWKQERRPITSSGTQARQPSSPGFDASALHDQSDIQTAGHVEDSKTVRFDDPEQKHDQSIDPVNSELGQIPLEDLWSQMLDESAHVALNTPDWMDLLTELTNATVPGSE